MSSCKHEKSEAGRAGLTVSVTHNNVEKALKKLKKMIQSDGLFNDLKKYEAYEKPSVTKRRKRSEARRRQQRLTEELKREGLI